MTESQQPLPVSFGRQNQRLTEQSTPTPAPTPTPQTSTLTSELPISNFVSLRDHSKSISTISLDPSGARLISGSYDYNCKLWDFGGMNSNFRPFRSWEPRESHQVHQTRWSNTGDSFLVITASNQPQLYDRDGSQIAEFIKGDMYIRDLRHCAGHIAELTSGAWNPKDSKTFITSSADSTIRIWDIENKRKSKSVIVLKSKERGTRTKITTCNYSPDGRSIAAAGLDGTLNVWSCSSNFSRPNLSNEHAHSKNTETSDLKFFEDSKTMVTRGGDGTVKIWDLRSFKKPLTSRDSIKNLYPESDVCISPDQRYVLVGSHTDSVDEKSSGSVVLLDRSNLETVQTISIPTPGNVIRVLWNSKINQIVTGSSTGSITVLYSPSRSTKGALLSLSKSSATSSSRHQIESGVSLDRPIITPYALPMFKNEDQTVAGGRAGKRRRERERQDPVKTLKPMPPLNGPGKGGRVGASATQHVVQGLVKDSIRHEDPREALLKFAQEHEGESSKYTAAWDKTMPKPIFDERLLEDEEEEEEKIKRRK
ncbi:WD40-repeat-containing domain protein [Phakopsora pachyrhizi]|uniref:WD40-repeat-containing domain protein n=1 Tax=Phakopsora pachyrhizi TaxID=170000 RepID=A0AAV0ARX7_PHAPC|nr:WD40-repeat-containing domain protein [Phakopsora pachyrhizi]KAI8446726.1 WD40-repeat-containing domain protein [Phakopsora pachyrhizi]CAH7672113.1 WD40-repeat-containing domain protein [Phakopsora pachyrhizi]